MVRSLILFLILAGFLGELLSANYFYRMQSGDTTEKLEWSVKQVLPNQIEIISTNYTNHISHKTICDSTLATIAWYYKNPKTKSDFQVKRHNDKIHCFGLLNADSIDYNIDSGNLDWLQFHGIALSRFVNSGMKQYLFTSLKPDNLKPYKLLAKRQEDKDITINGQKENAVRVTLSLPGVLAKLGHVTYYFRKADGLFLRFEGITGIPGIKKTTYELISPQHVINALEKNLTEID